MKIFLGLTSLFVLVAVGVLASEKPAPATTELTLEEVIFDASHLQKLLGAKTLLFPGAESGEITSALLPKLTEAGFGKMTRFFAFPDNAAKPKLKHAVPFPLRISRSGQEGSAHFVALVGTDGKVKSLYCYQHTDRVVAMLGAVSIIRWHYQPAKFNGTAVPVLVDLPIRL